MSKIIIIFGMFAGVIIASKFAGANAVKAGVGILAMSAALLMIAGAIKILSTVNAYDLKKATTTIGKIMILFAGVVAVSKFAGANAAKAGVMLALMSGAILILSGAIVILSHITPEGLDQALEAITTLEIMFAGLIAVSYLAKDCKDTLIIISVTIGLLAIALGALSMINPDNLTAASNAMAQVMLMFSILITSTHFVKKASGTLILMSGVVLILAGILVLLSKLPIDSVQAAATGLSMLLLSLSASMLIISHAGTVMPTAYVALGIMTLVVAALAGIVGILAATNVQGILEIAEGLSVLLLSLSASCLILGVVGLTGPAAFIGIGALVTLIVGIGGLMAGIGALAQYNPDLEMFLNKGIVLLKAIANGLGSFFGEIANGFMTSATSGLENVGDNLSKFARRALPFFNMVKGIDGTAMSGVKSLAETMLILTGTEIINGITSLFKGDNDMTNFGTQLVPFGRAIKNFGNVVKGLDPDVVTNATNAGKAIAEMAAALPNTGGVVSWFTGDNDMGTFGEQLKAFGESIKGYSDSVADIQMDAMSSVITEVNRLVDMANGMASVDTGGMNGFSTALIQLGNVGIDEFINNFSNAGSRISTAATNMITNFISGINAKKPDFIATFTLLNTSALTTITNSYIQFLSAGSMLMTRFIDGIKTQESSARITLLNIVSSCITAINNQQERFRQAGAYLVAGFANGISENTYLAEARSREMASAAISAAKSELDEHSPSKVAYRIGDFFGLGFVNAIGSYGDKAYNASKEMAQSAKDGLNRAIAKVTAEMNDDIDSQPTIRPVLDLSDVESKSQRLNALFSRSQALSISTGIKASRDQEIQNEAGNLSTGNSYNFVQNNYSPKALSRIEIYRQTRNQFSAMKEVTR